MSDKTVSHIMKPKEGGDSKLNALRRRQKEIAQEIEEVEASEKAKLPEYAREFDDLAQLKYGFSLVELAQALNPTVGSKVAKGSGGIDTWEIPDKAGRKHTFSGPRKGTLKAGIWKEISTVLGKTVSKKEEIKQYRKGRQD